MGLRAAHVRRDRGHRRLGGRRRFPRRAGTPLALDVENLLGTAFDDRCLIGGFEAGRDQRAGAGQNIIKGLAGADKLTNGSVVYGGDGNDTITGAGNQSYLVGERGNDTITGTTVFDLIDGGLNTDTCTGEKRFNCGRTEHSSRSAEPRRRASAEGLVHIAPAPVLTRLCRSAMTG